MIRLERYRSEKRGEWDVFVKHARNSLFLFERDYMDYHSDRFSDHSLLFYEEDELLAVLPANERDGELHSHQGLTFGGLLIGEKAKQHSVNDCLEALAGYMKENGLHRLHYKCVPHVFHRQPAEEDLYTLFRMGAVTEAVAASTVIDLKNPYKMTKGRKAQISRARREGVSIRIAEEKEEYSRFIELENAVLSERHDTRAVHSAEELFLLHSRFPEQIRLYEALYGGELIAGCVVYVNPQTLHTQYMAANETARQLGALDLAVAAVMEDYRESHAFLDFGISTERDGKELNGGLIAQKESFGGRTNVYVRLGLEMG
ncbi:MAG: GNAT family N-acetyltransferase [Lachnospiraceae bacterium]|nr:GNAT family N-acetyltransferase [Lachnospiraceae bacterium]